MVAGRGDARSRLPAGCASNYIGEPSPEIPADAALPLAPGVYKAFRTQPADGVFDPATIEFELAPFVECSTPGVFCEEPYAPDEVGVGETARVIAMPLDDAVDVVVGGFGCSADGTYETDHQAATGSALATLQAEYEAAYAAEVAPLVAAGTPYDDYQSIFADGRGGFSVPCSSAGALEFRGSAGPAILMQVLGAYDDVVGEVVVPASISIETLYLTALEVGADGHRTLYFYAGFLSRRGAVRARTSGPTARPATADRRDSRTMRRVIVLGAGGRDFHDFAVVLRDDPGVQVVAFTAAQIPGIDDRRLPSSIAGPAYPEGIPIRPQAELTPLIREHHVDEVVLSYSDLSYADVMHLAAEVLAAGADFRLLGPDRTMLRSSKPVVAVWRRTGAGKSQTTAGSVGSCSTQDCGWRWYGTPCPTATWRRCGCSASPPSTTSRRATRRSRSARSTSCP
ncbi:MAG: hypothetical protein R2713_20815 [Ilumatobacteraceae bacterium]